MAVTATLTLREVRAELRRWVGDRTLEAASRELGVTSEYLSMVLSGHRVPGAKVRQLLGLTYTRRTIYTYQRVRT
jgi:hypothetical protein